MGAPPLFIAHGDRDSLIPAETARLFAERMRGGSAAPVVYAELPGAQHGFDRFHSIRFERVVDAVEDFAAWVRLREPLRPGCHSQDPIDPRVRLRQGSPGGVRQGMHGVSSWPCLTQSSGYRRRCQRRRLPGNRDRHSPIMSRMR